MFNYNKGLNFRVITSSVENSCTWTQDIWLHIAGTNEPKSVQQVKQEA